jgi:hypothetical protein
MTSEQEESQSVTGFTLGVGICQNKTRFAVESRIPAKMTIFCAGQIPWMKIPFFSYSIVGFETLLFLDIGHA